MSKPFLIFALPRSMTAWASCFLTIGDVYCEHELPLDVERIVSFIRNSPFTYTGIADPGMLLRWKEITDALPDASLIYLRRPSHQSQRSLARVAGCPVGQMDEGFKQLCAAARDFIQAKEPTIIEFSKLPTEDGACSLWKAATGDTQLPATHCQKMLRMHIQQHPDLIIEAVSKAAA